MTARGWGGRVGRPRSATLVVAVGAAVGMSVLPVGAAAPDYSAARSQPLTDPYYSAKGGPSVDALHYDLDLSWDDEAKQLTGTAVITFRAPRDEPAAKLDLGRPLHVDAATLDGVVVSVTHSGNALHVDTGPMPRNSRHRLVLRYHGRPAPVEAPVSRTDFSTVGWTTRRSGQVWTMQEPFGALTWYPVVDSPSDKAFYDLAVNTRKDWHAVSNGTLVANHVAGAIRTMRWHLATPVAAYLVTLAIGPYSVHHDVGPHGLPLTYWTRPSDRAAVSVLRRSPKLIGWLERRLGRFPFDRAGALIVPGDSGMETQTMLTLGDFFADAGVPRWELAAILVHEYAHQWYGDAVTPRTWPDLWLNESFAMYFEIRWRVASGHETMSYWRHYLAHTDQRWRNRYGPPGAYDRRQFASLNVYYCGALMLDRLRSRVGPHVFAKLLRRWPHQHWMGNADRHDWIRFAEKTTGDDRLHRFVHRWLMSPQSPA